jgi:hypothetical protein
MGIGLGRLALLQLLAFKGPLFVRFFNKCRWEARGNLR